MVYVNWLSIIIASISSFILGYLWYSPLLFRKKWKEELNISDETLRSGNYINILIISFLMMFVYCYMLAKIMIQTDFSGMADGLKLGFMIGLCFSAMSIGINYQFSRKSITLFIIDAGYMLVSSTMMGAVLGWLGS